MGSEVSGFFPSVHQSHPLLHYPLLSQKRYAAVDVDGLAGDEIAQRRGQEQHGADDILRASGCASARAVRRTIRGNLIICSVGFSSESVLPGARHIDIDVVLADFARQRASETDGCRFRCYVMNSPGRAGEHGARCDLDDFAGFLFAHGRQHGAAAKKQAAQIHRHQPVPFFRIDGFDSAAVHRHDRKDRSIVDQHVDSAEMLERCARPSPWLTSSSETSVCSARACSA